MKIIVIRTGKHWNISQTDGLSPSEQPTCEEKFYSVRGDINYSRDKVVCPIYTYIIALPSSFLLSYKYQVIYQAFQIIVPARALKI